jgi:hypothetical protein
MIMPKANPAVSSEVVVQIVEAPKAEYVVSVGEAQQIDTIVKKLIEADELLFEGDSLMETTAKAVGKLLGVAPTYAQYNTVKAMFVRKYMAQVPSATEETTQKRWERLFARCTKETGLTKPKAPSASAQKMSEKRKAEVEMLGKLTDNQLVDLLVAYKNEDNFTKANSVKAEMKRRNADAESEVNTERKALRETIRKQLAQTGDIELLRKVSAMLPKLVDAQAKI